MRRFWGLFVLVAFVAAPVLNWAQPSAQQVTGECETVRIQRELEARYEQLAEANRQKDLDTLLALRTRDFIAELPGGSKNDYNAAADYSRAMFQQVDRIAVLSNTILKLSVQGNEATATVFQQFSRTQMKPGLLRNVETSAIQDETWVRTPEGWKNRRVSNIHARKWYVDGKRVDPNKPYDPNAPPYNPQIEADE